MTTVCAIGPVTGWGNSRLDYLWLGIVIGAIGWGLIAFDRRDRA
jgi:hypothetical protein